MSGMKGVRVREGEFEGQCAYCLEYHPLIPELWPMHQGLRRCTACLREYKRLKQLGYVASNRDMYNAARRAHTAFLPLEEKLRRLAVNRAYKARHRDRIAAYNRAYRARKAA